MSRSPKRISRRPRGRSRRPKGSSRRPRRSSRSPRGSSRRPRGSSRRGPCLLSNTAAIVRYRGTWSKTFCPTWNGCRRTEAVRKEPKRSDLHYADSLLGALEPKSEFMAACIVSVEADQRLRGNDAATLIAKSSALQAIGAQFASMGRCCPLTWQQKLFAASFPDVARALPRQWRVGTLRELCQRAQGSCDSAQAIGDSFNRPGVNALTVSRAIMEWDKSRYHGALKTPSSA